LSFTKKLTKPAQKTVSFAMFDTKTGKTISQWNETHSDA
jgi:hypothetical protein